MIPPFKIPNEDNVKSGRTMVIFKWCHYATGLMLGYIQVTPMTNGDLPLARQIALLPRLIDLCNRITERLPSDSDPVLELKALRDNASEILQLIDKLPESNLEK